MFKHSACARRLQFFDIGVNATDPQFQGIYRAKQRHVPDLQQVWDRSIAMGCERWLITGGDVQDAATAIDMSRREQGWTCTAGVHPTRSDTVTETTADELRSLLKDPKVRAFGEFGLDYDRFNYSSKESQLRALTAQLQCSADSGLPLFLHSRGDGASGDLINALSPFIKAGAFQNRGVVHSFTGSIEEMRTFVDLGFSIGVNGCSLKTEENVEVVKAIPVSKLMFETDSPWCEIRPTHASYKYLQGFTEWYAEYQLFSGITYPDAKKVERYEEGKTVRGRNEPCSILQIAYIVSTIKALDIASLSHIVWQNTTRMF